MSLGAAEPMAADVCLVPCMSTSSYSSIVTRMIPTGVVTEVCVLQTAQW